MYNLPLEASSFIHPHATHKQNLDEQEKPQIRIYKHPQNEAERKSRRQLNLAECWIQVPGSQTN